MLQEVIEAGKKDNVEMTTPIYSLLLGFELNDK